MTLFEIGDELARIQEMIGDGGEIGPELEAWFDRAAGDEAAKFDAYVNLIRRLEADGELAKARGEPYAAEAKRYAAQRQTAETGAKRLRDRLRDYLDAQGRAKAVTAEGRKLAVVAVGGAPQLDLDDDKPIPAEFMMSVPDEAAIEAALKAKRDLPFARWKPKGKSLRIG